MILTLPCDGEPAEQSGDVDFSGYLIPHTSAGKTHYLRTMSGAVCCSGHPLADEYLDSLTLSERGWLIKLERRRIDGLDARGVATNGTLWRWVGPLLGEFAEYKGVDAEAAKYFDAILDSICFQSKH